MFLQCTGHLENVALLSFADFSQCWHIALYNIKNAYIIALDGHHWPHQESLELRGPCQVLGGSYRFSKFLIFMWKLRFYYLSQSLSVVLPEVPGSLFIIKKLSTKYPTLNHLFASHYFKLKWHFMKEKNNSSACNSVARVLFLQTTNILPM